MGGAVIVLRIQMDLEEKISILEEGPDEIVTHDELRTLPETKKSPRVHWSGTISLVHTGQGISIAEKLKYFTTVGFNVETLMADWHSFINDMLVGDLESIYTCWKYVKGSLVSLGADDSKVTSVFASDLINDEYGFFFECDPPEPTRSLVVILRIRSQVLQPIP